MSHFLTKTRKRSSNGWKPVPNHGDKRKQRNVNGHTNGWKFPNQVNYLRLKYKRFGCSRMFTEEHGLKIHMVRRSTRDPDRRAFADGDAGRQDNKKSKSEINTPTCCQPIANLLPIYWAWSSSEENQECYQLQPDDATRRCHGTRWRDSVFRRIVEQGDGVSALLRRHSTFYLDYVADKRFSCDHRTSLFIARRVLTALRLGALASDIRDYILLTFC